MAAPYTNQAGTWVITTPLAPPSGLVNTYAGGWVSRGGVFAAAVSHVTAVTDNITGYDENDDPVFGDGVNIQVEGVGWLTIDGTRNQIAALLGLGQ
ncbi:hypothetical protein MMRN_38320 [Mycobacterium marinum]|uniref:hypothetical protein n=1 Tax=Mycobacterium marinum TaxID=1781 RepID=UPI000CD87B70|nr:hypothetical protein [Mycobacterium marinum]AXN50928.1 hypothetical protein CCUG20998_03526 [Mycobacterium marinum]RFZ25474.1 hypothetical protein DSM43519_01660 [Mycobacterium marinum]RFZ28361.1 hypothetical protein DSM44344_01406 [Mycobacterium marinum]RFZ33812.1 hypothetical protein NCTC2275_02658 [Mycobacterium marinum]WOR02979.1 hypothetical protein QDR78_17355 [Mycobacterium marinum]